jgi:aminoglycoside 3-N-acetyltransferase
MTANNRDPSRWSAAVVPPVWWPMTASLPPFDPAATPSHRMGAVAELVRTWPGAFRSAHPQSSFAGLGPLAWRIAGDHDVTCHLGERSPLARLEECDADVLLLGVGFDRSSCFHLAEYRRPTPPLRDYSCMVRGEDGAATWFTYHDVDLDDGDFGPLGEAFAQVPGAVTSGGVGSGQARRFSLTRAVAFATSWLALHRGHQG